ncbi:MAG: type II toxin-antitoxin system VapC family toxin [Candidatus Levyibacteriota bacterium]
MTILIDTQVFVWLINKDKRLGKEAIQLLADTQNTALISYFSFFEMTIKASIGKLTYDSSVINDLPRMGIELIMPDVETLQHYTIANEANRDPFDNILMAVAHKEKYVFMTSDPKILAVVASGFKLLDATK